MAISEAEATDRGAWGCPKLGTTCSDDGRQKLGYKPRTYEEKSSARTEWGADSELRKVRPTAQRPV